MSKNTLVLKQKQKYGWDEIYITADSISPLMQILDVLKASDVNTHCMRFRVTDEKLDLEFLREEVGEDDVS